MVLDTCDHIVVLNFGEVLADGTPEQIAADERVIEAYLGAAEESSDGGETASIPASTTPVAEESND
jgi:branched-chain amino acid transport system permease protein